MAPTPLKQWITTAIQSTNNQLTPSYIAASLRIAIFLTKQIIDAEVSSDDGRAAALLPPPFPLSCIDWADCIAVTLNQVEGLIDSAGASILEPLSVNAPEDDSAEDILDLFAEGMIGEGGALDDQGLMVQENGFSGGGVENALDTGFSPNYLNVGGARLVYNNGNSNSGQEHVNVPRDKLQRIYSLGLVFYLLFSGGDLIPPELLVVSSNGELMNITASSGPAEGEELEIDGARGNTGLSVPLDDFSIALHMSEENELAHGNGLVERDDEIYRSDNMHQVGGPLRGSKRQCGPLFPVDGGRSNFPSGSNKRQSSVSSTSVGQSASSTGIVRCDDPIDYLRTKGVPVSLCDLIYNMIDCINGCMMKNDTYSEMFDVMQDLQLMLERPATFLNPLDVDKLSNTGLELDENLFVRDSEFASLQCAYQQSVSGSSQLAIISGSSGTGKTTMANRLGEFVTTTGGVFLSGKFDQMNVNSFLAVAAAFNKYCDVLEGETERAMLVAFKLRASLGQDVHYLMQIIPSLRCIMQDDFAGESDSNQDCVDAQQRLHYLLCRFVEVICECLPGALVLFIDDMQWADSASISIISHLLKTSRSRNDGKFFFLGSCRDDEMSRDHPFWNMVENVRSFGFKATQVKLECVSKDTLNDTLSHLLHQLPRQVRSLSDIIYHKTKGNPLFVTRMLRSLNQEGLLRVSLTRHRWEWNEEKIQSRKIPQDVALFFVDRINTLPVDVKLALGTLSCFGNSSYCEVINAIEKDLDLNLAEPLNDAIAEGLLDKLDDKYYFCHDKIQESAYSLIDKQDVCLHHMNYGLSLMNYVLSSGQASYLYTAVTQINLGGPKAVTEKEHYPLLANYNLLAGKNCMEMSEFSSAFNFFDNGISFLRAKHWKDHYELSLDLYNLAAKCALAIKDITSLTMLCDAVSKNARLQEDALSTSLLTMAALLAHTQISDSVDYGFNLLSKLGVDIPASSSEEDTKKEICRTQSMLSGISDDMLLSYHILTDYKKGMAMKVLAKMIGSLNQCRPLFAPLVTIKLVRLTVEHGLSPMSAIGFAYFGGMVADLGDLRGGHRFTKLAKSLLDKYHSNEIAGEVMWVAADSLSYIEPLQVVHMYRLEGHQMSMAAGDIHCACVNKLLLSTDYLWSGVALSELKKSISSAQRFMEEHGHITSSDYMKIIARTVLRLVGSENENINDDQLTRTVIQNKNPYQLFVLNYHDLFLSLVFNNYDDMNQYAMKFFEYKMPSWYLQAGYSGQAFYGGLVSYRIYRKTRNTLWAQRGREFKERLITWKEQGSVWNFANKVFLLEAEESFSNGDYDKARTSYENAVSTAKQHKFVHEEALAQELRAIFYLAMGNKSTALKYFMEAHEKYFVWEAFAKVKSLYAFIQATFGNTVCEGFPRVDSPSDSCLRVDSPNGGGFTVST